MFKLICPKCKEVHNETADGSCPHCGTGPPDVYDFRNSEEFLRREVDMLLAEREEWSLEGLVGDLEFVTVNTEPDTMAAAVRELIATTGHGFGGAFRDAGQDAAVLSLPGSADLLVTSRRTPYNPFAAFNEAPRSRRLPNTRLETFVFACRDLDRYVDIQTSRGLRFMSDGIQETDSYRYIQSPPSRYTGDSYGFVQWKGGKREHMHPAVDALELEVAKPDRDHLHDIGRLDHTATRVRAHDRDAAILEFLEYTNYRFQFAIYVKVFNSITNVAKLGERDFAMVFTSGISPYISDRASGPTEKFIHNYGPRVHHMAFDTEHIERTFEALGEDGMEFLLELVGSEDDGLKQTFSETSPNTLLVNEYIRRYGDFDGFFTRSNVTDLTGATDRQ